MRRRRTKAHAGSSGGVDVYAHTWNADKDVADAFNREYTPYLRAASHEALLYKDKAKPRSQALSIGRAAQLMTAHEAARGLNYTFCLVLRADLVVGAPIDLGSFDPAYVWFSEHCCLNDAVENETQALVRQRCELDSPVARARQTDPRYAKALSGASLYRKRLLGPCRVTQYGGHWGLQNMREDYHYFLMDWWFGAAPAVAATWLQISDQWEVYRTRMMRLKMARWFSHWVWPIHVHDVLNATARLRFRAGVRVNLVRSVWPRLQLKGEDRMWLGEYKADAVGACETLRTIADNRTINTSALLTTRVPADSPLRRRFEGRVAPMAEQCAVARLEEPVVCCGEPRRCGEQLCTSYWPAATKRFFDHGKAVAKDFTERIGGPKWATNFLPPPAMTALSDVRPPRARARGRGARRAQAAEAAAA